MSELSAFDTRLAGLIAALSPQSRKAMAATIAKRLRKHQQQRIEQQDTPDGKPFTPRRTQPLRAKKGRIKREMFAKLRTAKYMKAKSTADDTVVEFTGQVQRMAKVHQYGLRDRPSVRAKEMQYPARPLLGLDAEDMKIVESELISFFILYKPNNFNV